MAGTTSFVPLVNGERVEEADYRDALPVNLYAVLKKVKRADGYLLNHPGLVAFTDGFGVDRGSVFSERFGRHFRVSDNRFIEVGTDGVIIDYSCDPGTRGHIPITGTDSVRFAQSFNNLATVTDRKVWYYNDYQGLRRVDTPRPDETIPPAVAFGGRTFSDTNIYQGPRTLSGMTHPAYNGTFRHLGFYGYVLDRGGGNGRLEGFLSSRNGMNRETRYAAYTRDNGDGTWAILAVKAVSPPRPGEMGQFVGWMVMTLDRDVRLVTEDSSQGVNILHEEYYYDHFGNTAPGKVIPGPDGSEGFGNPIDITFINGVFFMTDGEHVYHTQPGHEEQVDLLAYASAEFLPDEIRGVATTQDNLAVVFGRYSIEYFVPDPSNEFAFTRSPGLAIKAGLVATHAKTELDGLFFILGGRQEESPSLHIVGTGRLETIATREIDRLLESYNEQELATAVLETRVTHRDKFIYVHLPRHTLLYNHTVATVAGSQAAWSVLTSPSLVAPFWQGINMVFDPRIGAWLAGSRVDARIGKLTDGVSTCTECRWSGRPPRQCWYWTGNVWMSLKYAPSVGTRPPKIPCTCH